MSWYLAPDGLFLLNDWIRQPLQTYLTRRMESMQGARAGSLEAGFRLFPVHNKYTPEDWQWLLTEAGLTIRYQTQLVPHTRYSSRHRRVLLLGNNA